MKENNIGISFVLTTKALTDAFQALLLNNRYCVMRTSSPSTTSIIQQSINAPVSFSVGIGFSPVRATEYSYLSEK